jgi:hypothetical protein
MYALHEPTLDHLIEKRDQAVVEAPHVQERTRFRMVPELCPRPNLKQLLEGSDPAWQRDEAVGQLGHERLALVHRADHAEVGEPAMCDLLLDERTRHDACDFAAGDERRVGEHTHEADRSAAVDEADAASGEGLSECPRGLEIRRIVAFAGTAKYAQTPHRALRSKLASTYGRAINPWGQIAFVQSHRVTFDNHATKDAAG